MVGKRTYLWDAKTGERLATFIEEIPSKIERFNRFGRVISGALTPDASTLVSWDIKQGIRLWDTKTGKRITDLTLEGGKLGLVPSHCPPMEKRLQVKERKTKYNCGI